MADLTVEQVAAELACSEWWVREQVKAGATHYRLGKHKHAPMRFTREDVDRLKASLRPAPPAPSRKRRRKAA